MLPPIHNGMHWGLGPPNLDAMFSGLELEVRNSIDEIKSFETDIEALEKELEVALQQRENALLALANVNLESRAIVPSENREHLEQGVTPAAVRVGTAAGAAAFGQLERRAPTEEVHPGDSGQAQPSNNNDDDQGQRCATTRGSAAPDEHLTRADEPAPRDAAPSAPLLHPPVQQRGDDTAMDEASPSSPPLSAEEIKKRLLQVLRHLRDTATHCRLISDLDRGFSNMLKTTYKELYDSLKEVTAKGSGQPVSAAGAVAAAAERAAAGARPQKATAGVAAGAAAAVAQDAPEPTGSRAELATGAAGGGSAAPTAVTGSARDLSALARLVHAKRLHQQADRGAARDGDQPPPRRPARSATPATSASSRLPTLYDGLPPTRVAAPPGNATPEGPGAAEASAQNEAEPQAQATLETAAAAGQEPGLGSLSMAATRQATPGAVRARSVSADTEGHGPQDVAAPLAEGTPGRAAAGRPAAGGVGGCGGGQAGASQSCSGGGGGGSPSQQLLQQAKALGAGLARSLLLQTAQPLAVCEGVLSLSDEGAAQPQPQPPGGSSPRSGGVPRGGTAVAADASPPPPARHGALRNARGDGGDGGGGAGHSHHEMAAEEGAAAEGGGALPMPVGQQQQQQKQRAKRALERRPAAGGSGAPEPEPASASKRHHTGT